MKKEVARAVARAARELCFDVEVHKDYSGRGMYGQTTYGLVMSSIGWTTSVAEAAGHLRGEAHENFVNDLRNIRTDNMGFQYIYY